ncbi:hypothetical protein [Schlesneria sp. T3-172]|uniref:hypothetical protein n=1 Tax=Schlesneria sphaerica TaxID=3373610 RepID=UPI0037CB06F5
MRLTLRTLLAYLDDVLEPADTKIIGQKIQESPVAQVLVSRIREVMRRRRLKAPDVSGPEIGIDPNIVSQYLDTTLPPELYADVERVLLSSDELLAEVAACHQVLPVWLANPIELSNESRESLYALGPVDASSQLNVPAEKGVASRSRTPESISIRNGVANPARGAATHSHDVDESVKTVPDYLKPSPWPLRIFPSAVVGLLAILCFLLLAPGLITGLKQAKNEIERKEVRGKSEVTETVTDAEPMVAADKSLVATDESRTELAADSRPVATPESAIAPARPSIPEGLDPMPPPDEPDVEELPAPVGATVPKQTEQVPEPAQPEEPHVDVPAPAVAVNQLPTFLKEGEPVPQVDVAYASNEGVLARLDAKRQWLVVPHRSALNVGEFLTTFEPFEATLDFDKGRLRTTLIGNTAVYVMNPAQSGIPGLGIRKGQLIFQQGRQDNGNTAAIGVNIGRDLWKLELVDSDTVCGLEVTPREAIEFQKLHDEHWYQATLYVISGRAKWTSALGHSQDIRDHQALIILPEKDVQIRSNPISFTSVPDWCDNSKRKALPIRRYQSQVQFEKMFELNQPIDESMLTVVKTSKSPKLAELAAQSLSAIENCPALVATLASCPHEEARFVARDGLRQWLPMHPENGAQLMKELELHYPPAEAEAIFEMLWGFTRDDVTNSRTTSWKFVNWMRSPKAEIRELADFWVERLTGRKTEFRALGGTPAQRETQVHRLEELIERNNGLIKAP